MRVLVCGGRDFNNYIAVNNAIVWGCNLSGLEIISGMARGADELAAKWARKNKIPLHEFPADWKMHGKAAGPIRNQRMLDEGRPDLVIAFPGGKGTADMVSRARKAGVTVREVQ